VCEGGVEVPWGRLYRLGRGGEGAPGGHGYQWPCGLDGESRGGFKEWKLSIDGGEVKSGLHCGLKNRIEGGGAWEPAGNSRRP
jgi:hypothetical protein